MTEVVEPEEEEEEEEEEECNYIITYIINILLCPTGENKNIS